MNSNSSTTLPRILQSLIGWIAGAESREFVLGDLQEEYGARSSEENAQWWLWREVFAAIPGLLLLRLRKVNFHSIGLTGLITIAAYLILILWGAYVTRPIMIGLRDSFPDSQSINYFFWYLPVRITGIFMVTASIAYLVFRDRAKFGQNFTQRLLPLMLLILLPQIWIWVFSDGDYSLVDSVIRIAADGFALLLGAFFGGWLRKRRIQK